MADESMHDAVREAIGFLTAGLDQAQRVGRREVMFEPDDVKAILDKLRASPGTH